MSLKEKLIKNEITIGSWITIGHESVAEIMADSKFDWLTIDMEHSVIDYAVAQRLIAVIQSKGISALVRVSKNEEVPIKKAMDSGADGVIVPMINTEEGAVKAVSYTYYPPFGKRGVGLARAQNYGQGFNNYKKWLTENAVVIAQIEHIDAVNNIDRILDVSGIDGVIIGPYDLSASMGMPGEYNNENVIMAVKRIEYACKAKKKPLGFHVVEPDSKLLSDKIKKGYSFLGFSLDFNFLGSKIREEMETLKK